METRPCRDRRGGPPDGFGRPGPAWGRRTGPDRTGKEPADAGRAGLGRCFPFRPRRDPDRHGAQQGSAAARPEIGRPGLGRAHRHRQDGHPSRPVALSPDPDPQQGRTVRIGLRSAPGRAGRYPGGRAQDLCRRKADLRPAAGKRRTPGARQCGPLRAGAPERHDGGRGRDPRSRGHRIGDGGNGGNLRTAPAHPGDRTAPGLYPGKGERLGAGRKTLSLVRQKDRRCGRSGRLCRLEGRARSCCTKSGKSFDGSEPHRSDRLCVRSARRFRRIRCLCARTAVCAGPWKRVADRCDALHFGRGDGRSPSTRLS